MAFRRQGALAAGVGLVSVLLLFVSVQAAHGAVGDGFLDRCLNAGAAQAPCSAGPGQTGAYRDVLSPDGKQLYLLVAGGTPPGGGSAENPAILIYDRNAATGKVTRRINGGCVTQSGSSGACVQASQLSNPQDIVISPDGTSMYVSNAGTNSIIELRRSSTGSLTLISECQGTGSPCTTVPGMGVPHALAISPDGKSLYARTFQGAGMGTLLVFNRATNGTLTQPASPEGCWAETAQSDCKLAAGLSDQSWQIAATNTNVYSTGRNDAYAWYSYGCFGSICGYYIYNFQPSTGTIAIFGRNANGTLTQAASPNGCISNTGQSGGIPSYPGGPAPYRCIDGSDGLDQARSVTLSPDGKSLYVGGLSAIVSYSRGAGGGLTQTGCVQQPGAAKPGCTDTAAIGDVYRMAVTPAGADLIASSTAFNGYAFLKRNTSNGVLSPRAGTKRCLTSNGSGGTCDALAPLGGFGAVAVSPDSKFLYLVGSNNGVLATVHKDLAPVCASKTINVPFQQSVAIPLTCSDANGDALALAVSHQPTAGTLGGGGTIEPVTKTVRYSPPLGYSGNDSFDYVATGQGVQSAIARVTLKIGAPPKTGIDADGDGFSAAQDCNDNNQKINPKANEVRGNNIDENCDGVAQQLRDVPSSVLPTWLVFPSKFQFKNFQLKKLQKGWTVTVTCKGRGCPFKSKRIKNKKVRKGGFDAIRKIGRSTVFKPRQTLTVKFTAKGYNTKFAVFKLKAGRIPSGVARCQTRGVKKLRACR